MGRNPLSFFSDLDKNGELYIFICCDSVPTCDDIGNQALKKNAGIDAHATRNPRYSQTRTIDAFLNWDGWWSTRVILFCDRFQDSLSEMHDICTHVHVCHSSLYCCTENNLHGVSLEKRTTETLDDRLQPHEGTQRVFLHNSRSLSDNQGLAQEDISYRKSRGLTQPSDY